MMFLQGHQGAAAGTIANPGDMDAFKRQQAMVQAGRARTVEAASLMLLCFLPVCFGFFFLFFFSVCLFSPSNCFCF